MFDSIDEFNVHFDNEKTKRPNIQFNWRKSKEGEWVLSDDGKIIQVLKKGNIKHPQDRKNYKYCEHYIRTVVGTFLCLPKIFMDADFTKHKNRYTFSKTLKHPNQRVYKRSSATKKEKIFATNVAVGMGAVKSYMDAFSEGDSYKAEKKAAILLRQERVMKEVEKSVVDVAKSIGLDHEFVLEKLKCLVENSPEDNIVLNAVKEIGKAIGTMGGATIKQRETGIVGLFSGFQPDQLETAKRPDELEAAHKTPLTLNDISKEIKPREPHPTVEPHPESDSDDSINKTNKRKYNKKKEK